MRAQAFTVSRPRGGADGNCGKQHWPLSSPAFDSSGVVAKCMAGLHLPASLGVGWGHMTKWAISGTRVDKWCVLLGPRWLCLLHAASLFEN